MFDALFNEIEAMKDAWRFTAGEALQFIGDNLEFYEGVSDEYLKFMEVCELLYGEAEEGAVIH